MGWIIGMVPKEPIEEIGWSQLGLIGLVNNEGGSIEPIEAIQIWMSRSAGLEISRRLISGLFSGLILGWIFGWFERLIEGLVGEPRYNYSSIHG
jgi:hypothetical protein